MNNKKKNNNYKEEYIIVDNPYDDLNDNEDIIKNRKKKIEPKKKTINNKSKKVSQSKYFTHVLPNLEDIKKMRKMGMYEEDIAKSLGVGRSSWYAYKRKYTELMDVLIYTKEHLIRDLAESLFRLGLGGIKIKKTKKTIKKVNGKVVNTSIEEIEEELPPNVAAAIYSLNNLNPQDWTNRYRENLTITHNDDEKKIHEQTILALQKRRVKGFDDVEPEAIEVEIIENEDKKR